MKKFALIGEIDSAVKELFRNIADEKGYALIAAETMLDHAHLLIGLDGSCDLSNVVKMFKGISARKIFQTFPRLKQQLKINNFWARRYAYKEISLNRLQIIINYIANQKKDLHII